ncbi:unnamed protein product [Candida verbasci]|uniref:Derlin n=1 Tax=Candida verbasci TaxID=1227364 RepID=A0A9W4U1K2_9ASCO|nr:unnamed protein product [Candida verbasci]
MDIITSLPPITKGWCCSVLATSILLTIKKVSIFNLLFKPDKALTNQNYRILTSFITFNELSLDLIFTLFAIANSCKRIENRYLTTHSNLPSIIDNFSPLQKQTLQKFIDKNKSIDFLYYFIQIGISIVIVVSLVYYKLNIPILELGRLLSETFTYIDSRNDPNEIVSFMGLINFKNCYSPYFHIILNVSLRGREYLEMGRLQQIPIWKFPVFWIYLISYGLGHTWWVIREVLLSTLHYDSNDERRIKRKEIMKRNNVVKFDLIRNCLVVFLLPPWYWFIIKKINNRRDINIHQ